MPFYFSNLILQLASFNEHLENDTNESDCLRQSSDKVIDHPKIAVLWIDCRFFCKVS